MNTDKNNISLFRPVNQAELDLIAQSGYIKFPPRLPEQPIFYPVLNEDYAVQIARDWNVPVYGAGFVLRFAVESGYLTKYKIHCVGEKYHSEYWIPAEDLYEFNSHIIGKIEVVQEFSGA